MSTFRSLDVETANADLASICQIGIATFCDSVLQSAWKSFVNPLDYFDPINVSIHGIDEHTVRNAPTWKDLYPRLSSLLKDCIVVSHTPFDRVSVHRACDKDDLQEFECRWLDSARVVRRAWPMFARAGYGLSNVADHFSIKYTEHDALEDARCAGEIVLRACAETCLTVEQWLDRVQQPIFLHSSEPITRHGDSEGPLHQEVMVFTGALSLARSHAADLAASVGCEVEAGVTKRTTILVVGDQDLRKLNGHEKSAKHRKAESLMAQGQRIRIVGETDFLKIVHRESVALSAAASRP